MRKRIAIMAAAAALVAGPLVTAVDAQAAQSSQDTTTVGPHPRRDRRLHKLSNHSIATAQRARTAADLGGSGTEQVRTLLIGTRG